MIRPYRPQISRKNGRFLRTLASDWASARHYGSEKQRRPALRFWLHTHHHHRLHLAMGGRPPITLLTKLAGQYT